MCVCVLPGSFSSWVNPGPGYLANTIYATTSIAIEIETRVGQVDRFPVSAQGQVLLRLVLVQIKIGLREREHLD